MPGTHVVLPDAVIASGQTISNIFLSRSLYEDADSISIGSPATLPEAISIDVSFDRNATTASTWHKLQTGDGIGGAAADVVGPAAGKARIYRDLSHYPAFRLVAGAAVGADRTFKLTKRYDTGP